MTAPILEMDRVTRAFGGLIAVSEASLTLDPGELVGLVGPNGAGKSTTFNLACGYLAPTDGIVRFKGESIADSHPSELARRGLGRTFQTPVAFPDLSVAENVMVGQPLPRPLGQALLGRWRPQERQRCRRANELLEQVGLAARADHAAGDLSGGELRMLEVARQLMGRPELLLLDEPTAGVAPGLQISARGPDPIGQRRGNHDPHRRAQPRVPVEPGGAGDLHGGGRDHRRRDSRRDTARPSRRRRLPGRAERCCLRSRRWKPATKS